MCENLISFLPLKQKHGTENDFRFYHAVIDLVNQNEESISAFSIFVAVMRDPYALPLLGRELNIQQSPIL